MIKKYFIGYYVQCKIDFGVKNYITQLKKWWFDYKLALMYFHYDLSPKFSNLYLKNKIESFFLYICRKNIVEIMDIVEDEVQIRSAVTGKIRKVISINTLLSRPMFWHLICLRVKIN